MKILVVNNGSTFLPHLLKRLPRKGVTVVERKYLSRCNPRNFDFIILSGGHSYSIVNHRKIYKREIELIRTLKKPILGICLGFELIIAAFGGRLSRLQKKETGITEVKVIQRDPFLKHISPNFKAFESHKWGAQVLPRTLKALAISANGIEIVKHKTKPILGLQFHPEMTSKKSDGYKIIKNFMIGLYP